MLSRHYMCTMPRICDGAQAKVSERDMHLEKSVCWWYLKLGDWSRSVCFVLNHMEYQNCKHERWSMCQQEAQRCENNQESI